MGGAARNDFVDDEEERAGGELSRLVSSCLDKGVDSATSGIQQLASLTEKSVLHIGEALEAIVGDAQDYARHARVTLEEVAGSGSTEGIAQLVAAQNEILSAFMGEIRGHVSRQAEVAEAAMKASSRIASLGNQISSVASQSRLLSLNASIEAARLGQGGKAFGVIASEMTNLSRQVESTSRAVNTLISNLSEALPSVASAASDMRASSERFIEDIGKSIAQVDARAKGLEGSVHETMHSGDEYIAKILSHSQDALSALQFQDPVAQGLVAIAREFRDAAVAVENLVARCDEGWRGAVEGEEEWAASTPEREAEPVADEEDLAGLEAGEVMLF